MGLDLAFEKDRLEDAREEAKLREDRGREHAAVLQQRQARVNVKTALAAAFALAEEWVYTAQVSAELSWSGVVEAAYHDGTLGAEGDVAAAFEALLTAGLSASWKTKKAKNDWSEAVAKAMTVAKDWGTSGPIKIHEKLKVLLMEDRTNG